MSRPHSSESVFRALAHPTRRAIILALRHGESAAGQILPTLGHSKAALSGHLRALHVSGIVAYRRKGTRLIYGLNRASLRPMDHFLATVKSPTRRTGVTSRTVE
jgi:DNA-binding transcriptional ArsR family regulator